MSINPDLGHEIWRLDCENDDGGGPILELNQRVTGIKTIARDKAFMAAAYPEIVRQILKRIVDDGDVDQRNDPTSWQARWLRFGAIQAGEPLPAFRGEGADTEYARWIDAAANGFSRRQNLVAGFQEHYGTAEAERA